MDRRRPTDKPKGPATSSGVRSDAQLAASAIASLRRAGRDPGMLEHAVAAAAMTERLRAEGRRV